MDKGFVNNFFSPYKNNKFPCSIIHNERLLRSEENSKDYYQANKEKLKKDHGSIMQIFEEKKKLKNIENKDISDTDGEIKKVTW